MEERGRERPAGPLLAVVAVIAAAVLVAVAGGRDDPGTAGDHGAELTVERSSEPLDLVPRRPQPPGPLPAPARSAVARLLDPDAEDRLVVLRADGSVQSVALATGDVRNRVLDGQHGAVEAEVLDGALVLRTGAGLVSTDVDLTSPPVAVEGFASHPLVALLGDGRSATTVSATPGGWSLGSVTAVESGIRTQRVEAVVAQRPVDVGPAGVLAEVPGNALVVGLDGEVAAAVPGVPLALTDAHVVTVLCEATCDIRITELASGEQVAVPVPADRLVERRAGPRAVVGPDGRRLVLTLLGGPGGGAGRQPAVVDLEEATLHPVPMALPPDVPIAAAAWSSDGRILFIPLDSHVVVWSDADAAVVDLGPRAPIVDLAVG